MPWDDEQPPAGPEPTDQRDRTTGYDKPRGSSFGDPGKSTWGNDTDTTHGHVHGDSAFGGGSWGGNDRHGNSSSWGGSDRHGTGNGSGNGNDSGSGWGGGGSGGGSGW
ncbi:MAG TPA: hypothetical protein VME66_09855 [Candidatus Acidoferrales bacterium]|nr:hypothetical protein [Candidatus Acidoferrales bacterium]